VNRLPNAINLRLPTFHFLLRVTAAFCIGLPTIASITFLSGCLQDSPTYDKERTIALLQELLHDREPEVRRTAVESLGKIGDQRVVASILLLVRDSDSIVREASMQSIGRLKPVATESLIRIFVQALQDPVESVRQATVVAIGDIEPNARLLEPLIQIRQSSDSAIRRSAIKAFLQVDVHPWIPVLVSTYEDTDPDVRQGIVAAVGEWGGEAVAPWLGKQLDQDPTPRVRIEAAYRLSMLNSPETISERKRAADKDSDPGVRRWAGKRD